jgi:hypothetical protein
MFVGRLHHLLGMVDPNLGVSWHGPRRLWDGDGEITGGFQRGSADPNIFQWTNALLWLVGGDWNHGILTDFPHIGNNDPNWRTHIFQRVETTNQFYLFTEPKHDDFPVRWTG